MDGNYSKALELYDDVLGKYPWHIVALCCKKRCFEGLGDSTKAQEMMKMINELIKTNKRSQAMLMKYSDLMEELQKIVPNYDKSILNDNKFDEALTLGTKTN